MGFLFVIHVIVAVLLIIAILMQAGKGGGLAEGFSSAENLLGTQTNKFMVKVTAVLAALFLVISIAIAFFSAKRERSLMSSLPDRKQAVTVNVDELFNKTPAQTITINAASVPEKDSLPEAQPVVNKTK